MSDGPHAEPGRALSLLFPVRPFQCVVPLASGCCTPVSVQGSQHLAFMVTGPRHVTAGTENEPTGCNTPGENPVLKSWQA